MDDFQNGSFEDSRKFVLQSFMNLLLRLVRLLVSQLDRAGALACPDGLIVQCQSFLILAGSELRNLAAKLDTLDNLYQCNY